MTTDVIMPKFGMAQEEALVVRWLHAEGDPVEKGDALLEVETDKVIMEVESPASGILRGIRAREGEVVPVTQVIAVIVNINETAAAEDAQHVVKKATPLAKRIAEQAGIDLHQVQASENDGKIRRGDVERRLNAMEEKHAQSTEKPRATPAARFLAKQHNLALQPIQGSGPLGRIQAADVSALVLQAEMRVDDIPDSVVIAQPAAEEDVPVRGMRKTIASRLTQSYQTIPHVQFTVEAAAGGLLALRKELEPLAKQEGSGLSITSLLVKLCAWAVRRHPLLNSSWMDKKIVLHADVNIGMAVALEGGLIVPVIHRADTLGLGEINRRVHAHSEKARSGNLGVEEVSGGTFTISNLGMYGIDQFNALINPPECAILAVGRIRKQAVVVENPAGDEIIIAPVMNLTLSVDHRAIDGAAAAMFLRDLVSAIEKPGRIIW